MTTGMEVPSLSRLGDRPSSLSNERWCVVVPPGFFVKWWHGVFDEDDANHDGRAPLIGRIAQYDQDGNILAGRERRILYRNKSDTGLQEYGGWDSPTDSRKTWLTVFYSEDIERRNQLLQRTLGDGEQCWTWDVRLGTAGSEVFPDYLAQFVIAPNRRVGDRIPFPFPR